MPKSWAAAEFRGIEGGESEGGGSGGEGGGGSGGSGFGDEGGRESEGVGAFLPEVEVELS